MNMEPITFSALVNKHNTMLTSFIGDIAIDGMTVASLEPGTVMYWGFKDSGCGSYIADEKYHISDYCLLIYKIIKADSGFNLNIFAEVVQDNRLKDREAAA